MSRCGNVTRVPGARIVAILMAFATALPGCRDHAEEAQHPEVEQPASQEVRLSPDTARAAGIVTLPVSREVFHPHVVATGVVRPVAGRSVTVRAPAAGRVVRVLRDTGERVRTGQILAEVESQDLTAAVARYRTATARQIAARKSLQRAETLLDLQGISRAEVDQRRAESDVVAAEAAAARQDLARLGLDPDRLAQDSPTMTAFPIAAPLTGIVLSRAVSPGLLVERDSALFEVAALETVWAVADVYEKDLGLIQESGEVEVRTDAHAGMSFAGRIALIEPALDEASRTAHVRVVLDNRAGRFRPGMFVTVAVPLRGTPEIEATAVPADAIQTIGGLAAVFVETEPGRYALRPVDKGLEAHGMVEVRHGLQEGDRVVVGGAFILKSELLKGTIGGEEH